VRRLSFGHAVTGTVVGVFVAAASALLGSPLVSAATTLPALTADLVAPVIPAGTTVNAAQNWLQSAFAARDQDLSALSTLVAQTKTMSGDKSALNAMLTSTSNSLSNLEQNASNDNTLAEIRTDAASMVTDFRIFSFVDPMVRAVGAVDAAAALVQGDVALEPGIKAAIAPISSPAKKPQQQTPLKRTSRRDLPLRTRLFRECRPHLSSSPSMTTRLRQQRLLRQKHLHKQPETK